MRNRVRHATRIAKPVQQSCQDAFDNASFTLAGNRTDDEIIGGVQVVFSGFVSHPKKSLLGGRRITNHGIELPEFK